MELRGRRVVLRPPGAPDEAELLRIHREPEVLRWWGHPHEDFPFEEDHGTTFLVIVVDDAVVGWIEFSEEDDPDFRHASIDLFVDPARHRQGIARDAIETVRAELVRRGHHRLTIDPAAGNHAAIACYEAAGFRPVGVLRAAWRDPDGVWQDCLLLDWLVCIRAAGDV